MEEKSEVKRVLVVEDDEGLRGLIIKKLRQAGFEADGVSGGEEAVDRIRREPEIVLLIDHRLPDMAGIKVIKTMKDQDMLVPFVVMTGQGDERLAVEMMKLGAFDYLIKGLEMLDLLPGIFQRLFQQRETEKRLVSTADALRESEERFKALHNASFGGIAIHDRGVILDCNRGLSEMMGYDPDELVGMDGLLLIAERSREMVMKNILSGYEKPYEAFGLRKGGEEFPMRLEARNVPYRGKMVRTVEFRDITESRESERLLRESESKYRTLAENIKDVIWTMDPDTMRFTYVSPSVEGLRGFTPEEIMSEPVEASFLPENRERMIAMMKNGMESFLAGRFSSGDFFTEEIEQPCRDGSTVWTEAITRFLKNPDTGRAEIHGVSRDITARRKVEHKYLTLFREMLEGFALHEIICDGSGRAVDYRFLAANPAFEEMTGLKAADVVGKTVLEVLPGTEPHWIETYGTVALTGDPVIFDSFAREQGRHFFVTAFSPEPGQFATVFADVTKSKLAEEALKTALERLRRVTGSVIQVIVMAVESRDPYTAGHQSEGRGSCEVDSL